MQLRAYQQECIDTLESKPPGRYLVQMATGLGKTVTFANLPRHGDMLLLSHREELVRQPLKYFDCSTGVEMAADHSRPTDEVVSASVQSLVHRLEQFDPYRFHTIIVDEAHHAAARTYRKVLDYFQPEKVIGFTATPNRSDKARLSDVFDEIVFQRDLRWGSVQATEKQLELIRKKCRKYDINCENLTKFQASQILNRVMMR